MESLRSEWLWRKCKRDEKFFFRRFWYIKHPEQGKVLFDLRPAQEQAIDEWNIHRYSLTLKARQIGWSTSVAAHAFHLVFFAPDREVVMISRNENEAKDLLAKSKYGYKFLPDWLKLRGPQVVGDSGEEWKFSNDSKIVSKPSKVDPARGSTAHTVIVDEWASMPDGEQNWASIEPVADIGGRVIGLSTAKGIDNFFYQLWMGAELGQEPGAEFRTMFHPWSAIPERDDSWYEAKSKSMLPWQLAQEYPSNPEEAFIKSGNPVFDIELLKALERRTITPKVGYLTESP